MVLFLHPFWNTRKEPIMSQTTQIKLINTHYSTDSMLIQMAVTLGITTQI
jgi:hypothetical protein